MNSTLSNAEAVLSKAYPDYKKFFRYLTVGAFSTAINMSLYLFIISYTSADSYMYANIFSYHVGMIFSFFFNRVYTFRSAYEKVHYQMASFVLVAYSQLAIVELVLILVGELVFPGDDVVHKLIAFGIATAVGFVYAFAVNSRLTFSRFKSALFPDRIPSQIRCFKAKCVAFTRNIIKHQRCNVGS